MIVHMTNTTSNTSTHISSLASAWADIRNAQRRMVELNRPGTAKRTSR
jgi:hypothetical protein